MKHDITSVGLDVHKDSIEIALADHGGSQQVRRYGAVAGDLTSLDKAIRKLQSKGTELRFVYEAGLCGYEIYRHLNNKGFSCTVVAPSMVPKKSGKRVKTDRRDAESLARLNRSGDLAPIYVPREEDEAMRDLCRAREDAEKTRKTERQRLGAMLLRLGSVNFQKTGPRFLVIAHPDMLYSVDKEDAVDIEQILNDYRSGDESRRLSLFLAYREFREMFDRIEQESSHDDFLFLRFPWTRKERIPRAA